MEFRFWAELSAAGQWFLCLEEAAACSPWLQPRGRSAHTIQSRETAKATVAVSRLEAPSYHQPRAEVLKLRCSRLGQIHGAKTQGIIITRHVSEGFFPTLRQTQKINPSLTQRVGIVANAQLQKAEAGATRFRSFAAKHGSACTSDVSDAWPLIGAASHSLRKDHLISKIVTRRKSP
jgi:hypothetical protein